MLLSVSSRQVRLSGMVACLALNAQAAPLPAAADLTAADAWVDELDSIHVTGARQQAIAPETVPVDTLSGRALDDVRGATLGETVAKIPGVQNSYFGPAAGRPMIRGQSGERVALEINGLTSRDSSALSGDGAVPIEPFLADAIEVQKGPATILHGSDAIGGVFNVVDGRIPQQLGGQAISGRAELSGGDNAGSVGMLRLDGAAGQWAWQADALARKVSDVSIPGEAKADACRDWDRLVGNTQVQLLCQVKLGDITWVKNPNGKGFVDATPKDQQKIIDLAPGDSGILRGSGLTTHAVTIGGSRMGETGMVGASVNHYSSRYGVPGFGYTPSSSITPKPIALELGQTRYDLYARDEPDIPGIDQLEAKMGYTRANDREYLVGKDPDSPPDTQAGTQHGGPAAGFSGTQLDSTALDTRIEARHTPVGGFSGRFGVHTMRRNLRVGGGNAYLPSVKVNQEALFWMEQFHWNRLELTAGLRWEHMEYDSTHIVFAGIDDKTGRLKEKIEPYGRSFSTFNRAYAARYEVMEGLHLFARYDHAERAPGVMELFAKGEHFAILTEEYGNISLDKEIAHHGEIGLDMTRGRYALSANAYRTDYDNYLYLGNSGTTLGTVLPKRYWRQGDTRMQGLEAHASARWEIAALGEFVLDGFVDKVDAHPAFTMLDGDKPDSGEDREKWEEEDNRRALNGDHLPRTPGSRAGMSLAWSRQNWRGSVGAVYHDGQDKIAKNEVPSPAYTLVDAHAGYQFSAPGGDWEAFLDITNLTNREARPHHSFFRYRAPLAGRALALGVRLYF